MDKRDLIYGLEGVQQEILSLEARVHFLAGAAEKPLADPKDAEGLFCCLEDLAGTARGIARHLGRMAATLEEPA